VAPRPKLEDPRVREKILREIRFGVPPPVAAQAAGVSDRTFYRWTQRGRDSRSGAAYEFWHEVVEARAYALGAAQLTLTRLALGQLVKREVKKVVMSEDGVSEEVTEREFHPPHAGALQWFLERRAPEFYGAVAVRDSDTADPDEVMPPASAADDPDDARRRLTGLLDRVASRAAADEGPAPGGAGAGGD
jgi:hypothetical protein